MIPLPTIDFPVFLPTLITTWRIMVWWQLAECYIEIIVSTFDMVNIGITHFSVVCISTRMNGLRIEEPCLL